MTTWACYLGSGLKLNFHWKAQLLIQIADEFILPITRIKMCHLQKVSDLKIIMINHLCKLRRIKDIILTLGVLLHEHQPMKGIYHLKLLVVFFFEFTKSVMIFKRFPDIPRWIAVYLYCIICQLAGNHLAIIWQLAQCNT